MPIKNNEFIEVTYNGAVTETGELFDTTDEESAKQAGIHSPHGHFGPQIICVGEGHLLPGLDQKLVGLEIGTHTIRIPAESAFGKKNPALIQLIPISTFKKQNIQPIVGLQLNIDGQLGTVKVASGGRVLVDFNHPLAGKNVSYTITITKTITDPIDKLRAMLTLSLHIHQDVPITITEDEATIELPSEIPQEASDKLSLHLTSLCGLRKVAFTVSKKANNTPKHLNKKTQSTDELG